MGQTLRNRRNHHDGGHRTTKNGGHIVFGDANGTKRGYGEICGLNGITIKGSGDVVGDELKSDKLDIAINGSGDVKFKSIRADEFKVTIKGSGDVAINALESKLVEAAIRGSGDIKLPSLQAETANISIHGSGDVYAAGVADKVYVEIMAVATYAPAN